MKLLDLFRTYKKKIVFIFSLTIVENGAWIIEPWIFGTLIDEFILKANGSVFQLAPIKFLPLFLWILLYGINSGTGTIRRMYEPKIFQNIFADIVTKISKRGQRDNVNTSVVAGRAQLSHEYINFLQYRIPELLEQSIAIVGAICALTIFDWRISAACMLVVLPLGVIGQFYNKRVLYLQKDLHDQYETIVDTFVTKKPENIRSIYKSMANVQSKIGKYNGFNFGFMRLTLLIVFLAVLYISIDLDNFTTGDIYAIVSYLWTFITSAEYLPELMESRASLKDISQRISIEEDVETIKIPV
ncbi:MAG: ABC transporter six-transmembrane domain-containing protein [Ignavibacteriaceae bacterium]|nr:ABC transporter six-transmembrane domain-containing protein [Ignavibacteriaceae bacterium]